MATAFVLSGGGSLGAVQVGMLQALEERGIAPDLLIGTSAGALNAAFVAGRGFNAASLTELGSYWARASRRNLFPFDPIRNALAVLGQRPSLFSDRGLARTLEQHLAFDRIEDAGIPLVVIATDFLSGSEAVLDEGDAQSAVLASTAIPGLLPPVERAGRVLVDGSLADNAAISVAVDRGADRVIVLPTGYACALQAPPRGAAAVAMHGVTLLIQQRLIADVAHFSDRVDLRVLPPLCPLTVSSLDFGHAAELITRAHADSARWIDDGGFEQHGQGQILALHSHHGGSVRRTSPTSGGAGISVPEEHRRWSVGQVATQWGGPTAFVRDLIDTGMLGVRGHGALAISGLARLHKTQGNPLD